MSDMESQVAVGEVAADTTGNQEPAPAAVDASAAAVSVVAQQPSSASDTQQPEAATEAVDEPLSLQDAAKALLIFVKAHRTIGDADLAAAVADVEAALVAQDEQA